MRPPHAVGRLPPPCRPAKQRPTVGRQRRYPRHHKGRRSGSVIPNASTVILSGLHGGRVPSGHRAGTPPGYRAISVVQATIRSHLSRSNGSIRSSRPADHHHGGPQTRRARTYLAPGTRQGFSMILWCRTSSTPTSSASTSGASTRRGPFGPEAWRSQGLCTLMNQTLEISPEGCV